MVPISHSPRVSVIIPVFNGATYIKTAIESVLHQDFDDLEVIVVNDGSTDNTVELVKKYGQVRLITQQRKGANAARNVGIENSRAEYIKFLDADDYLAPGIIKIQVHLADSLPDNYIPYGYLEKINTNGYLRIQKNKLDTNQIRGLILVSLPTPLPLHRRSALHKIGLFNNELQFRQDWNLHIRMALAGYHFYYHDQLVVTIRIHNNPTRITNRNLQGNAELTNLNLAYSDFVLYPNFNEYDALACKVWRVGRQLELNNQKQEAKMLYSRAAELSKNDFLRYLTTKEKIMRYIYGPLSAIINRKLKKLIYRL